MEYRQLFQYRTGTEIRKGLLSALSITLVMTRFIFSLKALRSGVLDVIPQSSFHNLTAEDFRLLLNGCGEVNVQQLMSYTCFNDETGGMSRNSLYCEVLGLSRVAETLRLSATPSMRYEFMISTKNRERVQ